MASHDVGEYMKTLAQHNTSINQLYELFEQMLSTMQTINTFIEENNVNENKHNSIEPQLIKNKIETKVNNSIETNLPNKLKGINKKSDNSNTKIVNNKQIEVTKAPIMVNNQCNKNDSINKINLHKKDESKPNSIEHKYPYLHAATTPKPINKEKKKPLIVLAKNKKKSIKPIMNTNPTKKFKTIDYSFCVSVYFDEKATLEKSDFINDLVKDNISHWYIPNNKKNVMQLVCDSREKYISTLATLKTQSNRDSCKFKYMATPMNFSPGEHTLKYHTASYEDVMKYIKHIIKHHWKRSKGISEINMSYDRLLRIFKLRIVVDSLEDKEFFLSKIGYEEYRSIDQIINESQFMCSCNFPGSFSNEEIKNAVKRIIEKNEGTFNERQLEILSKVSPYNNKENYFQAQYKATNHDELVKITKHPVGIISSLTQIPIKRQLRSTVEYLTEKYKKQENREIEGTSYNIQFNNDFKTIENNQKQIQQIIEDHNQKLETQSAEQKQIKQTINEHTQKLEDLTSKIMNLGSQLTVIKNLLSNKNDKVRREDIDEQVQEKEADEKDQESDSDENYHDDEMSSDSDDQMVDEEDVIETYRGSATTSSKKKNN